MLLVLQDRDHVKWCSSSATASNSIGGVGIAGGSSHEMVAETSLGHELF
jgi:hypothetical protein